MRANELVGKVCVTFLAVVLASFAAAVNAQTAATKVTRESLYGSVKDGVYQNPLLGFELTVPSGWISPDKEQQEQAKATGSAALKAQSGANSNEIEEGLDAETVVLHYMKKPLGSIGNSTIALGIARQPGSGVTGKMVTEAAKELFLQSDENKLVQDIKVETIGGKQFASMILDMTVYGQIIRLKYYATVVDRYSITVSMIASNDASLKEMEDSLRSIKFKRQ